VMVVNPGAELQAIAEEEDWEVVCPERPFQSRGQMAWRCLKQMCGLGGL
jgi:hypothetical protein